MDNKDIIRIICSYLKTKDNMRIQRLCKRYREWMNNNNFWKMIFRQQYGKKIISFIDTKEDMFDLMDYNCIENNLLEDNTTYHSLYLDLLLV